jgi:hypothetical protein
MNKMELLQQKFWHIGSCIPRKAFQMLLNITFSGHSCHDIAAVQGGRGGLECLSLGNGDDHCGIPETKEELLQLRSPSNSLNFIKYVHNRFV